MKQGFRSEGSEGERFSAEGREGASPSGLTIYGLVLLRRRWLIIAVVGASSLLALLHARLTPPVYRAQAVVVPEAGGSAFSPLSLLGSQDISFSLTSRTPPLTEFHRNILESRTMAERVARRMELPLRIPREPLRQGWADLLHAATERVWESIAIEETRDRFTWGSRPALTVVARAQDPTTAAELANTYVWELDHFIRETAVTSASRLRLFVERRLRETNEDLVRSQRELQLFQERHGTVSLPDQASATIDILSELQALRVKALIELEAEKEARSPAHSLVRGLQAQLDALGRTIDELTYSEERLVSVDRDGQVDFYVPLTRIPALSFEATLLRLEVETQGQVVGFLTQQLEQAKIEEEKNLPLVTVLDRAIPPRRKVSPRPLIELALGIMVGCLGAGLLVCGLHYLEGPGRAEDVASVREALVGAAGTERRRFGHWMRGLGSRGRRVMAGTRFLRRG